MKKLLPWFLILAAALVTPASSQQPDAVRMGTGLMTFDTVPGWGLAESGESVLGSTHGGVVVDAAGNIYTSALKGVVVFSPDGRVLREFLGEDHSALHDIEIRSEGGVEYIYGARNEDREGIKFRADDGRIVLRLGFPAESGVDGEKFSPTAITVAPNGDIYLSDGYASNTIFSTTRTADISATSARGATAASSSIPHTA